MLFVPLTGKANVLTLQKHNSSKAPLASFVQVVHHVVATSCGVRRGRPERREDAGRLDHVEIERATDERAA
jgi:hypothetical protein